MRKLIAAVVTVLGVTGCSQEPAKPKQRTWSLVKETVTVQRGQNSSSVVREVVERGLDRAACVLVKQDNERQRDKVDALREQMDRDLIRAGGRPKTLDEPTVAQRFSCEEE